MRALFESIPLILGALTLIACAIRWQTVQTRNGKALVLWLAMNALIMLMAQSSWWYSVLILDSRQGEDIANQLWTIFNSSVMAFSIAACAVRLNAEH